MTDKEVENILKYNRSITFVLAVLVFALLVVPVPTAQSAYLGDRVLKQSMQGYDVQQLQKDLAYLNYNPGPIDSIFGPQTLSAVLRFQLQNGLNADGIVGEQTANALINQVSKPVGTTTTVSRGIIDRWGQDLNYLAGAIHGEARGEPYAGKVAVAAVILNRLNTGQFGKTIGEVIFQPGAFTAVSDGQFYLNPDASSYEAAQDALNGWDPTGGAIYYWNPITATNKWVWTRSIITSIGRHVFAI